VSGSSDGSVRVWDAIFVTPELQGHGGEVWSDSYGTD
jgi:WD40 repeat protein